VGARGGGRHLGRGTASHSGITDRWLDLGRQAGVERELSKLFLRGELLIALGLRPGPQFKEVLSASSAAQDDGLIHDTATATAWAAEYVSAGGVA
jgi:tRNA nucleotidyltransferase (CCA-adding enzyme)